MLNIFSVFIGGGIGAVLRYLTSILCINTLKCNLPIATFFVNILGCFILGIFYVYFVEKIQMSPSLKLAITVGFCGGLTTFSTFSLEIFEMLQSNQLITALIYVILSILLGIIAVYLGGYCAKLL